MKAIINGIEYRLIRKTFGRMSIMEYVNGINSAEYQMDNDTINSEYDFEEQCRGIQEYYS